MSKGFVISLVLIGAAVGAVLIPIWIPYDGRPSPRATNLKELHMAVVAYAQVHAGHPPSNMTTLLESGYLDEKILLGFNAGLLIDGSKDTEDQCPYIYQSPQGPITETVNNHTWLLFVEKTNVQPHRSSIPLGVFLDGHVETINPKK